MESTTKSQINRAAIETICKEVYGERCQISEIKELTDGCYNASYLVHLETENKDIIIKAAPSDQVPILSYEKDIMKTEVLLYKLVKDKTQIPIPGLIHSNFKRDIIPVPYFISERLYGQPLNKIEPISPEQRKMLYLQMAKYLALLHNLKGTYFGYPNMNYGKADYKTTFKNMVMQLLVDGNNKGAVVPIDQDEFIALLNQYTYVLDKVKEPVLVHFDLWDGNVFVTDMETNPTIEGLIDFERSFYGDRLADFVQVSFYIDLEKDTYFIDTYNQYASEKVHYGLEERISILLHKIYLFLIMIIESKYRDVEGSYDGQLNWASQEFLNLVEQLRAIQS